MAGSSFPEASRVEIVGEAVVGSGQYLAFTPCHKQPVRFTEAEVAPRNTVGCSKDGRRWDVSFVKDGVDWVAVWTPRT
ncbi:MAG: hypothetical protein ACRDYX_21335 [Egibacteraceae bacterium]